MNFIRYILAYFYPCISMAQIDDLNDAIANLNAKNNDLILARQNLDTAVTDLQSRASNIPTAPDLGPATAAVTAAANSLVETTQSVSDNITKINAVLPAP